MSHQNRTTGPGELGHRYAPRQPQRRVIDIVHQHATTSDVVVHQAVAVSAVHPPKQVSAQSRVRSTATRPAHPRQSRSMVLNRRAIKNVAYATDIAPPMLPVVTERRRLHPVVIFGGVALVVALLVFGGGFLLLQTKHAGHNDAAAQPMTLGASDTKEQAPAPADTSEMQPSAADIANYQVAADAPRIVTIPKLQLTSRVVPAEKALDGSPAATQNIFDAGWFSASARPGTNGVTLLTGQIAGKTKPGAFSLLDNLTANDLIQVELGNGQKLTYKVVKTQQLSGDTVDMAAAMKPAVAGKPGLNLLTSVGRYNVQTGKFEPRTLVMTVQQ